MYPATVVLSLLLAIALVVSAIMKLAQHEPLVQTYTRLGVPSHRLPYLASLLLAGALGLIFGLLWAPLGIAATIGLIAYFGLAIRVHLRANDTTGLIAPAVLAASAALVLILRLATL